MRTFGTPYLWQNDKEKRAILHVPVRSDCGSVPYMLAHDASRARGRRDNLWNWAAAMQRLPGREGQDQYGPGGLPGVAGRVFFRGEQDLKPPQQHSGPVGPQRRDVQTG